MFHRFNMQCLSCQAVISVVCDVGRDDVADGHRVRVSLVTAGVERAKRTDHVDDLMMSCNLFLSRRREASRGGT